MSVDKAAILASIDTLWGIANNLDVQAKALQKEAGRIRDYIVKIKDASGLNRRVILDSEGFDLAPLVERYAATSREYGMPVVLLLAMLKAESGLSRTAERWGVRTLAAQVAIGEEDWDTLLAIISDAGADISFGMAQVTVSTARGYGVGNGEPTVDNCLLVREVLFDRETSIRLGARHLANAYTIADGDLLNSLVVYNSGSMQPSGSWYWEQYAANVSAYQAALAWAERAWGQ